MKLSLFFSLTLLSLSALPAHADQIQVLDRGDQSLAAFYGSIVSAKSSIDLASFLFEPCESAPKLLLDAMVKKARSGVKVRILVDAYNQKQPNKGGLPAYLATVPNIQIRHFNDSATLLTANNRSHIKAFVVDGRTPNRSYIVGGRNMSDDYFGLGAKMNYFDQDLLIRGASATTAQAQFEELWASASKAAASGNGAAWAASCLKPNARDLEVAEVISRRGADILKAHPVRSCGRVTYALDRADFMNCPECNNPHESDDPLLGDGLIRKRMTSLFLDFIGRTNSTLEIANQYYMPYIGRQARAFEKLRDENVNIQVFANATGDIEVASRNEAFTCYMQEGAFAHTKKRQKVSLLSSRGRLNDRWELSVPGAPWRIHTKSAIRDGRDVLVSSFNIDPRSYNVNLESGVVVEDCAELAGDVSAQYEKLSGIANSDRSCTSCKAEVLSKNQTGNYWHCGGTPLFY